jgi:ubiquinone/menaquinone biosynthesis C-methylase UbiE
MRYSLQDYMAGTIGFEKYKSRLVLEIGSGSGIDSAEFARNGAEVVSLDFTKNGTEGTRDVFREAGLSSNVVRASAPFLPLRDDKFDCVYSFGVLHHIPHVEFVVSEMARILKPGADFITMFYNVNSLLYAYSILFLHRHEGFSEAELIRQYGERIVGCPYSKAYTEDELKKLFSRSFDNVTTEIEFNVIDLAEQRKVKVEVPDQYKLGWHIIAKGKKRA